MRDNRNNRYSRPNNNRNYNSRNSNNHNSSDNQSADQSVQNIIQKSLPDNDFVPGVEIIPTDVKKTANTKVKVMSIGGLGEIGKNTWVIEHDDQILIIDAGLGFPSEAMHGVDLVLPDLEYLVENRDKVVGMVITHGHEDHIGGIPNLLRAVNLPILYGPPLAIGLVQNKIKEHGVGQNTAIKRYAPREIIKIGNFVITAIRNNHSIPDSFGFFIQTPGGNIFHTGDFKFDHTPIDGALTDIAAIVQASKQGIDLMISDSTNAERAGFSPSEKYVNPNVEKEFIKANKRIIITTFASQVHRVGQIIQLAQKYGRKVVILGRSMMNIALIGRQLGYMQFPDGLLIKADEMAHYPLNKICILSTGSQGESMSALTRISNGSHRQISIIPGDTVVVSATPIPGNERSVASMINALCSRGANVIYGADKGVHVSGHASPEEQKLMINLAQPKNFMPAHGEYRMLVAHGKTALSISPNMTEDNIFVCENGDVLTLETDKECNTTVSKTDHIHIPIMMVDSNNHAHPIPKDIIDTRYNMSVQGLLSLIVSADSNGQLLTQPNVIVRGLSFKNKDEEYAYRDEILDIIKDNLDSFKDAKAQEIEDKIKELLQPVHVEHQQNPIVQITVMTPELQAV